MSNIEEWAKEYTAMLKGARQRSMEQFEKGIEEIPPYLNSVSVQAWLEELARAVLADVSPPSEVPREEK